MLSKLSRQLKQIIVVFIKYSCVIQLLQFEVISTKLQLDIDIVHHRKNINISSNDEWPV